MSTALNLINFHYRLTGRSAYEVLFILINTASRLETAFSELLVLLLTCLFCGVVLRLLFAF